jgi:hypothetical protein
MPGRTHCPLPTKLTRLELMRERKQNRSDEQLWVCRPVLLFTNIAAQFGDRLFYPADSLG